MKVSSKRNRCRTYRKYCGSTEVPCFLCYVTRENDSRFDGKTYTVRAVSIERFISERNQQGKTVYVFDYVFAELKHTELYKVYPNL